MEKRAQNSQNSKNSEKTEPSTKNGNMNGEIDDMFPVLRGVRMFKEMWIYPDGSTIQE